MTGPNNPHASPITSGPGDPGDDTLPAWSARLVTLNSNQIVPVKGNIDHMFIMEDNLTQAAIMGSVTEEIDEEQAITFAPARTAGFREQRWTSF